MRPDSEVAAPEGTATHQPAEADTDNSRPLSIPDLADGVDMLTAALAYAECGWYVLPVRTRHQASRQRRRQALAGQVQPRPAADHRVVRRHRLTASRCTAAGPAPSVFDVDKPDEVPARLVGRTSTRAPFQSTRPDTPGRGHYVFAHAAGPHHRQCPDARRVGRGPRTQRRHHGRTRRTTPRAANTVGSARDSGAARRDRRRLRRRIAGRGRRLRRRGQRVPRPSTPPASRPEILAGWAKALGNHFADGRRRGTRPPCQCWPAR